jgi:hypothetical protein
VLDVSAKSFAFTQAADVVTLVADGNTEIYPQTNVPRLVVLGAGANASATLTTNDSFIDAQHEQVQHAIESVILSSNSGTLYRVNPNGTFAEVIELGGFHSLSAQLTHDDYGTIVGTSGLINRFVSNGASSYMNSGTQAQLDQLDQGVQNATANYFITGANYVYGYSVGAADIAFHYDGSGPSTLVLSGTFDSYMSGTDQNQSFFNVGVGFTHTIGIAKNNAHDTAYFFDSSFAGDTALAEVFVGFAAYSTLYHVNPDGTVPEYDFALGFALVFANSADGNDSAVNYSPDTVAITGFNLFG